MNIVEELLYYIREIEPVGALLLTGEWGCGKTYLIEQKLREEISKEAVILRISLFSIATADEIHTAVRNAWLEEYSRAKGIGEITKKLTSGKEVLAKLDFLPDWIKGLASTDASVFFPIGNTIDDKKVVLVFDDLERCQISMTDVLGVINDYCENQKYPTIIVANEEKIQTLKKPIKIEVGIHSLSPKAGNRPQDDRKIILDIQDFNLSEENSIPYAQIKEKIIQRTVHYVPDYPAIVHDIIINAKYQSDEYKDFVCSCEECLLDLFAPDRNALEHDENASGGNAGRPHNIRSLKCAISDFYRVYCVLISNEFSNISSWFYSFTSYVISYKAGIAKVGAYGTLFTDEEVKKLYPGFQSKFIFSSVKSWILNGIWNKDALLHEIETIKQREKAQCPSQIIKSSRVMDIDEEIICEGFSDFLTLAYKGSLTLDEYVLFIENSAWARKFEFLYPSPIDWNKIKDGILIQINKTKEQLPEGQILYSVINEESKADFTDDEWSAYKIIHGFAVGNEYMFFRNRKLYIEKMQELLSSSFQLIQNKRFDVFDKEMANVTATAFGKESNAGKNYFSSTFAKLFKGNLQSGDMKIPESIAGLRHLIQLLSTQLEELDKSNKPIAKRHTQNFIESINGILDAVIN